MTDPAVALQEGYGPYDRGTEMDIWLKMPNGSAAISLVWPGMYYTIISTSFNMSLRCLND